MSKTYPLSFTAAGLMIRETVILADLYLEHKDWETVWERLLEDRLWGKANKATLRRQFNELRKRLEILSEKEMAFLVRSRGSDRQILLFVASCRTYPFVAHFISYCFLPKIRQRNLDLRISDYARFLEEEIANHPALEDKKASSLRKLQTVLFRMLEEADLIDNVRSRRIQPPLISNQLRSLLAKESPESLNFLIN